MDWKYQEVVARIGDSDKVMSQGEGIIIMLDDIK